METRHKKTTKLPLPPARLLPGMVPATQGLPPLDRALDPAPSTAAAKRHLGKVAAIGCILCRFLGFAGTPAEVHHPRWNLGAGQKSSDFDTIPLCPTHHRGQHGVHDRGHDEFTAHWGVSERELQAQTRQLLGIA